MNLNKKPLTLENIKLLLSDETIWHWLLSNFNKINVKFKHRDEDKSSAHIYPFKGELRFADFGTPNLSLSWLDYMLIYENYTFRTALEAIRDSFNLELGYPTRKSLNASKGFKTPIIYSKQDYKQFEVIIRYLSREWCQKDKEYWYDKYQLTFDELDFFKVIPLSHYWVIKNGIENYFKCKKDNPSYCYPNKLKRKIYTPYDKIGFKWFGNTTKDDIFGLHLLPKDKELYKGLKIFIIKAYKDTMVCYKINQYSIPTPSENSFIPEWLFYKLLKLGVIFYIWFDNDDAGIKNAKIFSEKYNIPYIVQPKLFNKNNKLIKDPSDFVEAFGYEELKIMINQKIKEINENNSR